MRPRHLITSLASSTLVMTGAADSAGLPNEARSIAPPGNPVPAYQWLHDKYAEEASLPAKREISNEQAPIMNDPSIALPPSDSGSKGDGQARPPPSSGGVTISDVLPSSRQIGIFSGLTRDITSVSKRLEDGGQNSTILAPDNSAMKSLPRKPWEDATDYDTLGADAYLGADGEDRAHRNLRRFVEAHILPSSPWEEGTKAQTLGGGSVWWETRDGKRVIQPGNVEVDSVVSTVSNGEVWVLKGVINYSSTE